MTTELFLAGFIIAVILYAMWALITVFAATFKPEDDVLDEVKSESAYTDALRL